MLFHVTPDAYLPGGLKWAGNWGKMIASNLHPDSRLPRDTAIIIAAETALETARLCLRPDAPSRLRCVYAWETLEAAMNFRIRERRDSYVYVVEPVYAETAVRRCDLSVLHSCRVYDSLVDHLPPDAMRYWTDEPAGLVEVLIGGPIRILSVVLAPGTTPSGTVAGPN